MKKQSILSQIIWKIGREIEEKCAFYQGKGFGAQTISHEYKNVRRIIGDQSKLIIDIGGNIGDYSAEICKTNKMAEIHIFEPARVNFEKLSNKFNLNPNIHIINCALGEENQESILYSDRSGSPLSSLTQRDLNHLNIDFSIQERIVVKRFDEYWQTELNARPINFAKIDVEGHELAVLNGFGKAILNTHVVQFEFGGCNIDTKTYFKNYWDFFAKNNFKLYRITPIGLQYVKRYRENDETFLTTNFLAVNNVH